MYIDVHLFQRNCSFDIEWVEVCQIFAKFVDLNT